MQKAKIKRNIWIIFIIFLCILGIIVAICGSHYFPQKQYEKQVAAVMDLSTDGAYLSGSAADSTHLYKDIYSVLLKMDGDNDCSAYVSFSDGTTVDDASVSWFSEDSVKLTWTVQDEDGVSSTESVSFSFCNAYPNGFYIISGSEQEIYDYTAVLDRSGAYVFDSDDITDAGVSLNYEDIDDFYKTGGCPEEVAALLSDMEEESEMFSSAVSSGVGSGQDISCAYCYANGTAFVTARYEEEYYYFRYLSGHWEAAKCEDDEPVFALYSSLFLLTSTDAGYLVAWQRSYQGDPSPAIYVSDDYGESFVKLVFDIEVSAAELLDIPYYADISISDTGTMQITLEAHRFGQSAMVIEIPDFDSVMDGDGTEASFSVEDIIAMPAN